MRYIDKFKEAGDVFSIEGSIDPRFSEITRESGTVTVKNSQLVCTADFSEHPSGVNVRKDRITNLSSSPINLSCALSKFVFDGGEYRVYSEYSEWCGEGQGKWQDLVTEVSASNNDLRMNVGSTPFFAIYNQQTGRGVAFHILAESTWCFRVKKHYSQTEHRKVIAVELGIRDRGFSYTLEAGESLKLPEILFYEFKNTVDFEAYRLHRYYNETYPAREMPVMYDTWMSRFDNISYDILLPQLTEAARLGCEYFTIDAGWFGEPNAWAGLVGDWKESTEFSMKGRMAEFADTVRSFGLKFGLWFEIERAAATSEAVKAHPEHYFKEGEHYFVDFRREETCNYIFDKIAEQIRKYGVKFIKFDFNAEISYDSTNRSFIDYFKGYNGFIKRLNVEFPDLYLENCASGGLRMALASLSGFDSFWISDNHSLYTQLEIFKQSIIRLPSRALEKWLTLRSLECFTPVYGGGECEKILSSGDAAWGHMEVIDPSYLNAAFGGPIGISCDLTKLSEATKSRLTELIAEFKRDRSFWASSECRILCDTDSMLVLQFSDSSLSQLKIFTFVKIPHQNEITVYPVCNKDRVYTVEGKEISGAVLDSDGIVISVGDRFTSKNLTLTEI